MKDEGDDVVGVVGRFQDGGDGGLDVEVEVETEGVGGRRKVPSLDGDGEFQCVWFDDEGNASTVQWNLDRKE